MRVSAGAFLLLLVALTGCATTPAAKPEPASELATLVVLNARVLLTVVGGQTVFER